MSLTKALKILIERGYLKPLDPRPLPDPLPAKHDPTKYCAFHQQPGHDTDRCFRLRHEIQDLIDNKVIAPPQPPKPNVTTNPLPPHDRVPPPPHLNLIHTFSSTFNPSIYITPTHLPKPEVFIPENTDLCMMDAPEPQSSQPPKLELPNSLIPVQPTPKSPAQPVHQDQVGLNTLQASIAEPTTSQLLSMIEDLQSTVADLAFGILAPSSTTSCAKNFTSKSSPILGRVTIGKGQPEGILSLGDDMSTTSGPHSDITTQSLGKTEASGKNEAEASIDPYAHLQWAIEALKVKGLNKQQVLAVVTKTMDDTFVTQIGSILIQGVIHKKRCCTRNTPSSSSPTLVRDYQTQSTPADLYIQFFQD
ncbi:hypothetical protein LOK49_LG05G03539 [Camellia lanceoleosa]|uniref:Uncharacterized protein n=1 Tax=Camellia lanceoleosa TaxID=1840588 RepID=A0ACC0HN65_9ERIC|nr:hypothetical protein LOK49_LG05G03539 [Camellia lanceoleosa]